MRVFLLDNYDSFTWNLVQAFQVLGAEVEVHRNDTLSVTQAADRARAASHVVISPGPGGPEEAGISLALMERILGERPLLGVCLGHQCLARLLGGEVGAARRLVHGKASRITHDGEGLFAGLPCPMQVGRYHSLAVTRLPSPLRPCARTEDGELMAARAPELLAAGVQFHPESILTPEGDRLLANFLGVAPASVRPSAALAEETAAPR